MLNKADLFIGKDSYREIPLDSIEGSICIRPLTIGEIHELTQMKNKALGDYTANQQSSTRRNVAGKLNAQAKMNLEKITIADNKADIKTVFWGLNNEGNPEQFTEDEIIAMKPEIFNEILENIKKISHMEDEDLEAEVDDFPEEE